MKGIIKLALLTSALLIPGLTRADVNISDFDGQVTASRLNVRTCPSTSCAVIGSLSRGEVVRVTHRSDDGRWLRIRFRDSAAYVYRSYITELRSLERDREVRAYSATVTASVLNVREGPGVAYKILHKLGKNQDVVVTHHNGNWAKIVLRNPQNRRIYPRAYVHRSYIRPIATCEDLPKRCRV